MFVNAWFGQIFSRKLNKSIWLTCAHLISNEYDDTSKSASDPLKPRFLAADTFFWLAYVQYSYQRMWSWRFNYWLQDISWIQIWLLQNQERQFYFEWKMVLFICGGIHVHFLLYLIQKVELFAQRVDI